VFDNVNLSVQPSKVLYFGSDTVSLVLDFGAKPRFHGINEPLATVKVRQKPVVWLQTGLSHQNLVLAWAFDAAPLPLLQHHSSLQSGMLSYYLIYHIIF
jgi:hypothetical protein